MVWQAVMRLEDLENSRGKMGVNLTISIRDLLLQEISRHTIEEKHVITELANKIREGIGVFPLFKNEAFNIIAGVDAGSQILPLASRRYAVISAIVYCLPSGMRYWMPPESISFSYSLMGDSIKGIINIKREAKLYETAASFIKNSTNVELLLIDGPLAFSEWWKVYDADKDLKKLIDAKENLLELCYEKGVIIAGIVKRPSARYLIQHLGLQDETDLHDSFLLLHALRPGERTEIFSPKFASMKTKSSASTIVGSNSVPIYSFYCRMTREWSIPPIRIDLPAYDLGSVDDIADYCYSTSMSQGIPLPIIKADEAVKITRHFMADVYLEILSRVGRQTGEVYGLAPYWGEGKWMGA